MAVAAIVAVIVAIAYASRLVLARREPTPDAPDAQ
jgi:hypothetical protein